VWGRVAYFARETMVSLRRNVGMTIAGITTVAVSLSLFGGILLLSKWVDHGTESIKGGVTLEIFMKVDASQDQIAAVGKALAHDPNVKSARHLNKDDAYREFKRIFKNKPDLVNSITAADLPESFRVAPKVSGNTKIDDLTNQLKHEYQLQPGVDTVETPGEALKGVQDVTDKVRAIFIIISIVLLGSSLFLIVNTIRLATYARRREIEVMKLVGATNWFVRGPFMLEGLLQGVIGSVLAVVLLILGKSIALPSILGHLHSTSDVHALPFALNALALIAAGVLLGAAGSGLTLRRFLQV